MSERNYNDECGDHGGGDDNCGLAAGWGTDFDSGKCRHHRGTSPDGASHEDNNFAEGNSGGSAPENNQNATTHGIHADPANVLDDLAENNPEAYEWVERKQDSYLETAPFGPGSAKADQLRMICVREYCAWRATGVQVRDGMLKKTHIQGPEGELHEVEDEHSINIALDRAERTITRRLKELGVLDDPDSQRANATETLADVLDT